VTTPNHLTGAKVLVADDDSALVGTLTWILKGQGCSVVAVPDGEGLLQRLDDELTAEVADAVRRALEETPS
jgi:CheY-like chemotaxis protein